MSKYDVKKIRQLISIYQGYENFIGFIHCTELCNFINIYKEGFVLSRSRKKNNVDSADKDQIKSTEHKHPEILDCVRFYLAPKTPTYYRMNFKNPVMIVIDENILSHLEGDILFVDKQLNSRGAFLTSNIDDALKFDYQKIFDRRPKANRNKLKTANVLDVFTRADNGQMEPLILIDDQETILYNPDNIPVQIDQEIYYFISKRGIPVLSENSDDIQFRNSEIAFEFEVSLDYAIKFYFRDYDDMLEAIKQLEIDYDDMRFEVAESLFHEYRSSENEYIEENDDTLPF